MRKSTIIQLLLSLSGILIVVLLFQQPKFIVEDEKKAVLPNTTDVSVGISNSNNHNSQIDSQTLEVIKSLTSSYLNESNLKKKSIFADSLGEAYRKSFDFDSSAKYFEVAATLNPVAEVKEKAALGIFEAFQNSMTADARKSFGQKAIGLLDELVNSHSERIDLKIKKAVVQVYTEPMPMNGINALKEIIEQNPSNTEARLYLGEFQFTVGKYDNAIEQFKTVIKINPTELKALLYLTESYLALGQKDKAGEYIKILKELDLKDPYVESVVEKFENELKSL